MEKNIIIIFYALLVVHTVCDAMRDGWIFDKLYGDGVVRYVNSWNWHPIKNAGRAALAIGFYVIGRGSSVLDCLILAGFAIPGLWAIWQITYNTVRIDAMFTDYELNITKLTGITGRYGLPLSYFITRWAMRIISVTVIGFSVVGFAVFILIG